MRQPELWSYISIIGSWLICAIAVERIAEAITDSFLFSWLREAVSKKAFPKDGPVNQRWLFLSKPLTCGYCASGEWSVIIALFLPGNYFELSPGDNICIKAMALWGMANLWHSVFELIRRGRVLTVDFRHTVVEQDEDSAVEQGDDSNSMEI